jgi:hypothetical protein
MIESKPCVPGVMRYTDGDKVRCALNSGSLQVNSGFGKRFFSLTTHPVYPIIVFHPDTHCYDTVLVRQGMAGDQR